MGYISHKVIVVTSYDVHDLKAAQNEAVRLFKDLAPVSDLLVSPWNGFHTFIIGPDGSKSGWDHERASTVARDAFIEWLRGEHKRAGRDYSRLEWFEAMYGQDMEEAIISRKYMGEVI